MNFNTDPFAQDKKEIKLYGLKITKQHSLLTRDTDEAPNTTTNTITLVKAEPDAVQCHNLMAVNSALVAYSLAKPLIRVMNPATGAKTLLRGHEARILDLRFSAGPAGNQTLCSVDDGDASSGGHHTFIWTLENVSGELGFSVLNKFFLNASIVESHPIQASTWVIATNSPSPSVGLVSGALDGSKIHQYSELPLFKSLGSDYTIVDMSFSLDGKYLALAVQSKYASKVLLYSVPSIPIATLPPGFTQELTECASVFVANLHCVRFTSVGLVTASKDADSAAGAAKITVQVYSVEASGSEISVAQMQSVTTVLPLFEDSSASPPVLPSLSPLSSHEFGLCASTPGSKFIVLYHRRSNFIASYAINPLKAVGYPLYHTTVIDLKFPIDSMFCNLVSGQDHFSSETIDQLQLSCFQAQPSLQLGIQQFRIAVDSLAGKPSDIEDIESSEDEATPEISPVAIEPFVSPFTSSPLFDSEELASAGVGEGSILKMLKSSNTATTTAATTSITAVKKSEPVAATAPVIEDTVSLASAGPLSPTPSVASDGKSHSQSKSILGLLKGILVPTPTAAPSAAAEKILPVTAIPTSTTSTPVAVAATAGSSTVEEEEDEEDEEDQEEETSATATSVPRVPSYSSAIPDAALDSGNGASGGIARTLSEVKYQIVELRKEQAMKTTENHIHIKETVIDKIQKAVHESTHSSNKKLAVTIKELLKGAVEEQQTQITAATTAAVKSSLDGEVKKALDATLKTKSFTNEVTKAVADAVKAEIIASINQSLPQIVSTTVKEAVTQSLSSTFRLAFENTLLPSFEAGTTRMFAQVEESFDSGLERLEKQARYATEVTRGTVDELQEEVSSLKSTISSLESKIAQLTLAIESGVSIGIGNGNGSGMAGGKKLQDPVTLLKEGKVPEALECALEYKSIEKLVELLGAMSGPSQLAENCDYLLQLCAIQQLAADFAKSYPVEGTATRMEWLKGFVSTLISLPLDDPDVKRVISSILASLKAAESRIQTNLAGGDSAETANHSNLTDLRIMIAVISSRC